MSDSDEYSIHDERPNIDITRTFDFLINFRTEEFEGNFDVKIKQLKHEAWMIKNNSSNGMYVNLVVDLGYEYDCDTHSRHCSETFYSANFKKNNMKSVKKAIIKCLETKIDEYALLGLFLHGSKLVELNKKAKMDLISKDKELRVKHLFKYSKKYKCKGKLRFKTDDDGGICVIVILE